MTHGPRSVAQGFAMAGLLLLAACGGSHNRAPAGARRRAHGHPAERAVRNADTADRATIERNLGRRCGRAAP